MVKLKKQTDADNADHRWHSRTADLPTISVLCAKFAYSRIRDKFASLFEIISITLVFYEIQHYHNFSKNPRFLF